MNEILKIILNELKENCWHFADFFLNEKWQWMKHFLTFFSKICVRLVMTTEKFFERPGVCPYIISDPSQSIPSNTLAHFWTCVSRRTDRREAVRQIAQVRDTDVHRKQKKKKKNETNLNFYFSNNFLLISFKNSFD